MSDQEPSKYGSPQSGRPTRDDSAPILGDGKLFDENDVTRPSTRDADNEDFSLPPFESIDRYLIEKTLGQGGFGTVFLATDPRLERQVAIKLPRVDRPVDEIIWRQFIDEGRAVANLKHEAIIQVYDIDRQPNGMPFVVMEYVEGETLQALYNREKVSIEQSAQIIRQIAEGLRFAHKQNIVHRDLKPANIMIDKEDQARIADFGLALHDNTPMKKLSKARAGTTMFMAPEQLRGENHRLDGRTDLWALGVTMYWMLTAKYPFNGEARLEVVEEICSRDPKPIRQLNEKVPLELERVCLRCLCKLMPERYQSAQELIEDIEYFQQKSKLQSLSAENLVGSGQSSGSGENSKAQKGSNSHGSVGSASHSAVNSEHGSTHSHSRVRIVPKGLRSFDAGDVEFFLSLLPGPTDRFGVPDSIRFWQQAFRKEDDELPIGLLYGPSGSGKTSFVRAGLIPRLSEEFYCVRVECTANTTEKDIVHAISRCLDEPVDDYGVHDLLYQLRAGRIMRRGRRMLIVLDQFEQWLNANEVEPSAELIEAIRQCDGDRLQCLLLVRDDFWIATHDFMKQLDVKIQEGKNAQALPLFDERHARKVLTGFGQAYDLLPSGKKKLSRKQRDFVKQAIGSLSNNGKVICAHLALFAEMMKSREWTSAEFAKVGGWEGIGVRYLEEAFGKGIAPPHRQHQSTFARKLLARLVPETGADIKLSRRTRAELAESWDGDWNDEAVSEVLETLDSELRLVTRTIEDDGWSTASASSESSTSHEASYQLSHDVLVEPIRQWLTQKQRETWRGRASVRLSELTSQWHRQKEKRLLPSLSEYLSLSFGTKPGTRSEGERSYMKSANQYYGLRMLAGMLMLGCVGLVVNMIRGNLIEDQVRSNIQAAIDAKPDAFAYQVELLKSNYQTSKRSLPNWEQIEFQNKYRLSLLKSHFDLNFTVQDLVKSVANVDANECHNFVDSIRAISNGQSNDQIGILLANQSIQTNNVLLKFRLAIMALHFSNLDGVDHCVDRIDNPKIRTGFEHEFRNWHGDLVDLIEILKSVSNSEVKTSMCNSFALMGNQNVSSAEFAAVVDWLKEQRETSLEAGLHFSAESALHQWGVATEKTEPRKNSNWVSLKLPSGGFLEMVRLDAGVVPFGSGLSAANGIFEKFDPVCREPFYFDTKEVSCRLFFEYVDDATTHSEIKDRFEHHLQRDSRKELDVPIYGLTYVDAVQFCNWLGDQFELERVYKLNGSRWEATKTANGFRLPKFAEWEKACRSGSTSSFFFGDSGSSYFLNSYSWCGVSRLPSPYSQVGERAAKLPNSIGIFDILGNASEFNHEAISFAKGDEPRYAIRGGSTKDGINRYFSGSSVTTGQDGNFHQSGIRLVIGEQGPMSIKGKSIDP